MKRLVFLAAALLVLFSVQHVVASDNATTAVRPAERFSRGVVNILSSPLELPAQMYVRAVYYSDTSEYVMATVGGFLEGIPMGALVYFPWRLGAGIYDVTTFAFARCNRCLINPPYLSFSPRFLEQP